MNWLQQKSQNIIQISKKKISQISRRKLRKLKKKKLQSKKRKKRLWKTNTLLLILKAEVNINMWQQFLAWEFLESMQNNFLKNAVKSLLVLVVLWKKVWLKSKDNFLNKLRKFLLQSTKSKRNTFLMAKSINKNLTNKCRKRKSRRSWNQKK